MEGRGRGSSGRRALQAIGTRGPWARKTGDRACAQSWKQGAGLDLMCDLPTMGSTVSKGRGGTRHNFQIRRGKPLLIYTETAKVAGTLDGTAVSRRARGLNGGVSPQGSFILFPGTAHGRRDPHPHPTSYPMLRAGTWSSSRNMVIRALRRAGGPKIRSSHGK